MFILFVINSQQTFSFSDRSDVSNTLQLLNKKLQQLSSDKKQQVVKYEEEIAKLNDKVDFQQLQISKRDQHIEGLEGELDELVVMIATKKKELDELTKKISDAEAKINTTKSTTSTPTSKAIANNNNNNNVVQPRADLQRGSSFKNVIGKYLLVFCSNFNFQLNSIKWQQPSPASPIQQPKAPLNAANKFMQMNKLDNSKRNSAPPGTIVFNKATNQISINEKKLAVSLS